MTGLFERDLAVTVMRPRLEGANIRTWIGFKHLMYLAEDAVLSWLRERGLGAQHLYQVCGIGIEVVDASVQLPSLLEIDDEVIAETTAVHPGRFSVRLRVDRGGESRVVLTGKLEIALVRDAGATPGTQVPENWEPLLVDDRNHGGTDLPLSGREPRSVLADLQPDSFYWSWQARYFHCNYSDRVQHSGYVRALEEIVDRFLADRGLSIPRLLAERSWIPVVSRARVRSLASAHMGEIVHTTFAVEDILKMTAYDGRMDCYVQRGEMLKHVAFARILHGYAVSAGSRAGKLAVLDDATVAKLTGAPATRGGPC